VIVIVTMNAIEEAETVIETEIEIEIDIDLREMTVTTIATVTVTETEIETEIEIDTDVSTRNTAANHDASVIDTENTNQAPNDIAVIKRFQIIV